VSGMRPADVASGHSRKGCPPRGPDLNWIVSPGIEANAGRAARAATPQVHRTPRSPPPRSDPAPTPAAPIPWFCWHGNVFRALQTIDDVIFDLDTAEAAPIEQVRLLKAVREFDAYLRANAGRIPNYGERYRAGEAISTAFTESAVNQVISKRMVKKQQMRWTPRGAHLLLQVRTPSSTTSSPATSTAATPASIGCQTLWRSWRSLPPLCPALLWRRISCVSKEFLPHRTDPV
jgi:hypothetical protein